MIIPCLSVSNKVCKHSNNIPFYLIEVKDHVSKYCITYDFYKRGLKYQGNAVKPNYTASLESFIGDLFIHRHH